MSVRLYYTHDPMCSWCWGFRPVWLQLQRQLPETVEVIRLLGGLAPDSDQPMPEQMQQFLQQTWHRIEQQISGVAFNFDFWHHCQPRRSTYPACRAVIAARQQGSSFDEAMTLAIQQAYYQQARNPSNNTTLIELAEELNLDRQRFSDDLDSTATQQQLQHEIQQCRQLGAQGFPSLIVESGSQRQQIRLDYTAPEPMLNQIKPLLG